MFTIGRGRVDGDGPGSITRLLVATPGNRPTPIWRSLRCQRGTPNSKTRSIPSWSSDPCRCTTPLGLPSSSTRIRTNGRRTSKKPVVLRSVRTANSRHAPLYLKVLVTVRAPSHPVHQRVQLAFGRVPRHHVPFFFQVLGQVQRPAVVPPADRRQSEYVVDQLSPVEHVYRAVIVVQLTDQSVPIVLVVVDPVET